MNPQNARAVTLALLGVAIASASTLGINSYRSVERQLAIGQACDAARAARWEEVLALPVETIAPELAALDRLLDT